VPNPSPDQGKIQAMQTNVQQTANSSGFLTAAFYKFVDLPDYENRKPPLLAFCEAHQVKGLILLAREGINSTIAGKASDVYAVLDYLKQDTVFSDLQHKESFSHKAPFYRMKVRLKKEIVTMGLSDISLTQMAGTYVKPEQWNELIQDPSVVLIDTRNDYEVEIGTFKGAINPNIKTFSELPEWLQKSKDLIQKNGQQTKIAMFCTGGIRCEKSTAYLRSQGFDQVFHLEGGILKYLEQVAPQKSLWDGQCFVFDERVSVGHGLEPGLHQLCRSCRDPLPDGALDSPLYEVGVSCPRCFDHTTEEQKNSARERQRQWQLAHAKQQQHVGAQPPNKKPVTLLPMNAPVLYSFRRCPYAMRARLGLMASGIPCELREVALKDKPPQLLEASPKGTVPVLVLPDQVIEESMQIMMWALQKNDPQSWLPTQPEVQQRALQIVEQCDGVFKFNLDRYKYPNRYDIVDGLSHRDAACEFLIQLDAQLQQYRFLIDDQWRWLDAAVAPFVRQFAKTDREWFKQQSWNALKQWLVDFESSDRLARVMASYKPWHMGQRQVVFAG